MIYSWIYIPLYLEVEKRNQNHIIGDKFCSNIEFLVFVRVEIEIEKEK